MGLIRLCGYGGKGDPNEIVCGEWRQDTFAGSTRLKESCDFGNKHQGPDSHWIEDYSRGYIYPHGRQLEG